MVFLNMKSLLSFVKCKWHLFLESVLNIKSVVFYNVFLKNASSGNNFFCLIFEIIT